MSSTRTQREQEWARWRERESESERAAILSSQVTAELLQQQQQQQLLFINLLRGHSTVHSVTNMQNKIVSNIEPAATTSSVVKL